MSNKGGMGRDLARYSTIGIQMVLMIGIFVFGGNRLDKHFETETPWWTAGLSIFGVIVAIIYMVRGFNRVSDKK